jgi:hypothetical protein
VCGEMIHRVAMSIALAIAATAAFTPGVTSAQPPEACVAPRYFVAVSAVGPPAEGDLLQVSVPAGEFSLPNLLCTVQTLAREHGSAASVAIFVFDARYAADEYVPDFVERTRDTLRRDKSVRATYFLQRSPHEEYLTLHPFGFGFGKGTTFDTKITLPASGPLECRFEVDHRCLLALDEPADTAANKTAADIELTGAIQRDGKLRMRVVATHGTASSRRHITAVATTNVKSWWFEPRARETAIRMTFRYGSSQTQESSMQLEFRTGFHVQVTAADATRAHGRE